MNYTFLKLISEFHISIPLIQRDYAQGRTTAETIRQNFIAKLKEVLAPADEIPADKMHLDFVYGYTENSVRFIPLDGQQRLTTLFLLHWYIAVKENHLTNDNSDMGSNLIKSLLSKFTYETRLSAKRFCRLLSSQPIAASPDEQLSVQVIDSPKFVAAWINDPTVKSMLSMLDAIHLAFHNTSAVWNRLISEDNITFEFIDIKSEQFRLTDELYIKMNSRGKPLTEFENFKAQFIGLLSDTGYKEDLIEYKKEYITYSQYFGFKIDGPWMDMFWDNRTVINQDDGIINFLSYLTTMLYYIDNKVVEEELKFDDIMPIVYAKKENASFLFESLNFLANLNESKEYFDDIFFSAEESPEGRVKSFDNQTTDLFSRSIKGIGFDVRSRVTFYALLHYNVNTKDDDITRTRDFVRIVRNLLSRIRQVNSDKRIEYTTNLRIPNFNDYSRFIHEFVKEIIKHPEKSIYSVFAANQFGGFTKGVIQPEKMKASIIVDKVEMKDCIQRLEDHFEVQAVTDFFDMENPNFKVRVDNFYKIWSSTTSNSRIVRAMLTFGNYAVKIKSSASGDIRYLGNKGSWNRVLTTNDDDERKMVSQNLNQLLDKFASGVGTTEERLLKIIKEYDFNERSWIDYFVNYHEITSSNEGTINLYAWRDKCGFDIFSLRSWGSNPLSAFHINPYVITLNEQLADEDLYILEKGRFSDQQSYINIDESVDIFMSAEGWLLELSEGYQIPDTLMTKYKLKVNGDYYLLKETPKKDRIQIALSFCRDIVKENQVL